MTYSTKELAKCLTWRASQEKLDGYNTTVLEHAAERLERLQLVAEWAKDYIYVSTNDPNPIPVLMELRIVTSIANEGLENPPTETPTPADAILNAWRKYSKSTIAPCCHFEAGYKAGMKHPRA